MRWSQDPFGVVRLFDRTGTVIAKIEPVAAGWRWEVLRAGNWLVDDAANPIDFGEQQTLSGAQECVADSLGLDARGIDSELATSPDWIDSMLAYAPPVVLVAGVAALAWVVFTR